jgi:chromosome partitioning protein
MKSISTVNFKGGVGKTTITWLLAKYVSTLGKKVLVVDTDAQMSLTMAVQLEDDGGFRPDFHKWYEGEHEKKGKTLLQAIERYDNHIRKGSHFDFSINSSFIYQMTETLSIIPSVVDLYWLELDAFDPQTLRGFAQSLLGKIQHSPYKFDYVFFDCPPNFTTLSYSVLSSSSLILIPVNPDVFATRGVNLIVQGLELRIEPWPNPKLAVFMNKAGMRSGRMTRESQGYWDSIERTCRALRGQGKNITALDAPIPDRVDIKRAIRDTFFPSEYTDEFDELWQKVAGVINS